MLCHSDNDKRDGGKEEHRHIKRASANATPATSKLIEMNVVLEDAHTAQLARSFQLPTKQKLQRKTNKENNNVKIHSLQMRALQQPTSMSVCAS